MSTKKWAPVLVVLVASSLLVTGCGGGFAALLSFFGFQEDEAHPAAENHGGQGHVRAPLPPQEEIAKLPADGGEEFNRLIFESSPYLLQHARNPVDWYPWGDAAFEKAKQEDKAVFLSIGYSTCHWCHVMERESFENEEVARRMNEHFVCIKVDREERPDVDAIYMAAVQAMTRRGGWPLSVFLTPERKPFWGGTYFPPEDRRGRAGFPTVLERIAKLWKTDRDELFAGSEKLTEHIRAQSSGSGSAELGASTLEKGYALYAGQFDATHGGFGPAPKFPRSHGLSFLLRYHARSGSAKALAMAQATLDHMARGGIRDHLGGGFHRYSTDATWLVPHFEKMLYDQALLARAYLEAHQVTGEERHAEVARDIFRYVLRDMTDSKGGFYSAEDADSEGVEGKFYVWTKAEIIEALGDEDGALFARAHGVTEDGNYHEETSGEKTGDNILHLTGPVPQLAAELDMQAGELERKLSAMRAELFSIRKQRVHPYKDDKILTDWNGLMIGALAYGGRVLGERRYIDAARKAAAFVIDTMEDEGRLLHRYRNGKASIKAFLEGYAFLSLGLLDLYETTFEVRWLREAERLAEEMVRLFWDEENKGFHFSGSDAERLIARTKELYDGAIPSGNSAATLALLKLGRLTMAAGLEQHADENLQYFSGQIDEFPMGYPFMLMALDFAVGPTKEVVLAGPADSKDVRTMHGAINSRFLPRLVLAFHPEGDAGAEIRALVPFLAQQRAIDGKATAYVCENYACHLPTTDVQKMLSLIEGSDR